MDLLDRVAGPAADLLDRVDDALVQGGAPADHPVWPLLRKVGALPGAAVAQFAALAPDVLRADADPLAALGAECRSAVAGVPPIAASSGAAAEEFGRAWHTLAGQIVGSVDALEARSDRTAGFLREVADWAARARDSLALALGACLGSAEAVSVRTVDTTPGPGVLAFAGATPTPAAARVPAAATIASRVLGEIARSIDEGWQVRARWSDISEEAAVRSGPVIDTPTAPRIELG